MNLAVVEKKTPKQLTVLLHPRPLIVHTEEQEEIQPLLFFVAQITILIRDLIQIPEKIHSTSAVSFTKAISLQCMALGHGTD